MERFFDAMEFVTQYSLSRVFVNPNNPRKPNTTRKTEKLRIAKKDQSNNHKAQFDSFAIPVQLINSASNSQILHQWKPQLPPVQSNKLYQTNKTLDDYLNILSESNYAAKAVLPSDLSLTQPTNRDKELKHDIMFNQTSPILVRDMQMSSPAPRLAQHPNLVVIEDESRTEPDTVDWLNKIKHTNTKNRYIKQMMKFQQEHLEEPRIHQPKSFDLEYLSNL